MAEENEIHSRLLTDISDLMVPDSAEFENFVVHMQNHVPRGLLARNRTLLSKLAALANRGKLGPGNYEILKKIATDSGNIEVLELINTAEQQIRARRNHAGGGEFIFFSLNLTHLL